MKTSIMKKVVLLAVIASLAACAGRSVQLGAPATQAPKQGTAREISGSACGFQLLLLIPIGVNSRLAEANKELIAQAAGDYITNVQVEESWFYAFVGTGYCTMLKATAIRAGA